MPGAERLRDCAALTELVAKQKAAGKLHAAICATPGVAFEPQGGWMLWGKGHQLSEQAMHCRAEASSRRLEGKQRPPLCSCQPVTHTLQGPPAPALVCASAAAGILAGKRATSHPAFSGKLSNQEAVEQRVVVDGTLVTSR